MVTSSLNSLSNIYDDSSSSSDSTGSFDEWDDLFGKGWRGNRFLSTNTSNSGDPIDLELEESLPDLEDMGSDSENDKDFSVEEDGDFESDMFDVDADNEMSDAALSDLSDADEAEAGNIFTGDKWSRLRKWVRTQLVTMYANRYKIPRDGLPQGPSYLHHVLLTLKNGRADHFHQQLRINPTNFDALVVAIEHNPVFMNKSNNAQMPVEEQLSITLFCFGQDGNASGLQDVANWAGVAKGTVSLVTWRVMVAVLHPQFMENVVRFPNDEEMQEAKDWVKNHSCRSWKNGWCFVDGSLIPLATQPEWFGESYWDRKDQYSLNVQVPFYIFFWLPHIALMRPH